MGKAQIIKEERVYIRLDHENKKLLALAATYSNETTSSFIRRVAIETANRIINANQILKLSEKDSMAFLNALDNPPLPNKALLKAAKRYQFVIDHEK